uniref:MULE transposase domain-containing protein n=2 Tax=Trichogramma kaykai TaxID=54128 RepID=A0ABD2X119_9HYME
MRFKEAIRTAARIHHEEPWALYYSLALIYRQAAPLVPYNHIESDIHRWRLSAFPDSSLSLERLEYQINSPLNDGLFRNRQGTMSTLSLRDLDDCRHFAFFDLEFINHIAPNISTIMIDVTYKSCIEMEDENMQLGTVMAIYQNYSIPSMWFLMITDFESSLRNALQETFPNSYLTGCLFYYIRGLIGKIQELNVDQYVKDNTDANAFFRKIAALAFLYSEDIEAQSQEILDRTPQEVIDILDSFIEYFQLPLADKGETDQFFGIRRAYSHQ